MTEIHAFDPDGTPSPGAQAALDSATASLAPTSYVDDAVADRASVASVAGIATRLAPIDGLTDAPVYIYVDGATGSDETGDGSTGAKFATIQRAVNSIPKIINQDRLIRVQAGTYDEDVYIRGISGANIAIQKAGPEPTDVTQPTGLQVRSIEALDISGRLLIEWVDTFNASGISSATTASMRFSRCQYVSLRYSRFTTKADGRVGVDFDGTRGTVGGCYFNNQNTAVVVQNGSQVKVYGSNVHGATKSTVGLLCDAATVSKDGDLAWARTGALTPESRVHGGLINDETWQTWTPTFPAVGGMTFASVTVNHARYTVIGKTCHYVLRAAGTTTGTGETSIQFTLPVPAQLNTNAAIGSAVVNDGGFDAGWQILANSGSVQVRKSGANNPWTIGTDRRIYVTGTYEIA